MARQSKEMTDQDKLTSHLHILTHLSGQQQKESEITLWSWTSEYQATSLTRVHAMMNKARPLPSNHLMTIDRDMLIFQG